MFLLKLVTCRMEIAGFSEDDLSNWLELTDEVAPSVVGFKFKNVMHLSGAYEAGWFDEALKLPAKQA